MELGLISVLNAAGLSRVYPRLPQNPTFPLVRYQRIYTGRTNDVGGENVGPTEFTIQLDCMAKTYGEAKAIAAQTFTALNGYRGAWGDSTCRYCAIQTEHDDYEQDGDNVTHWVTQRFLIWTNDD